MRPYRANPPFMALGAVLVAWALAKRRGGRDTRKAKASPDPQDIYAAPALPQLSRRTALWKSLGLGALAAILIAGGYLGVYYQSLQDRRDHAERLVGGRAHQGQIAIARYGCSGCHTIPGISRADGLVGPPLTSLPRRVYIAGVLKNSPDNLVRWIVDPRQINPQTAMPRTGISQAEARDVVAYLYTID